MVGYPIAFVSDGWHTSMSLQIFVSELVVDFCIYFSIWFVLIFFVKRLVIKMDISTLLTGMLWACSTVIFAMAIWVASNPDHIIQIRRDWDMKILDTGYKFTWTHKDNPKLLKYDPIKKVNPK